MSILPEVSLYLQLDKESLSIIDKNGTPIGTSEAEWIASNSQTIGLKIDLNYFPSGLRKDYYFIINNSKNEPIEQLIMTYVGEENQIGYFKVESKVVQFLKDNSIIYIGIAYCETGSSILTKSNKLTIKLINGINIGLTPEEVFNDNSLINQILAMLPEGKLIKELKVEQNKTNKSYELKVLYLGETEFVSLGECTPSPQTMGIIIERADNNVSGGGGKLGESASLGREQSGFAGGYSARTSRGASVGEKCRSVHGVALGATARALYSTDGIAIGFNAAVGGNDESVTKQNGDIAIGTNSAIKDADTTHRGNIAIGRNAKLYQTRNAIAIGGSDNNENSYTDSDTGKYKQSSFTRVNSSVGAIAIGEKAYITRTNGGIAIGRYAFVAGRAAITENGKITTPVYQINNSIAIGTKAICRAKASIAIGNSAIAGATDSGLPLSGNIADENSSYTSAIAIGDRAWARKHSSIALGKSCKALQYGCIAIGQMSVAGKESGMKSSDTINTDKDTGKKLAPYAIAIGLKAKATARGAVQIGNGENNEANTFKYKTTTIVKNGVVQYNLAKGQSGKLPIANGGTGATKATDARQNLGIYTGEYKLEVDTSSLAVRGVSKTIKFPKALSSVPKVVATLEMTDEDKNINPVFHHLIITSITKEGFTFKYNYNGSLKKKLNLSVNYIYIAT